MRNFRRVHASIFAIVALGGAISAAAVSAGGSADTNFFLIDVFDCYMPVPDDFVVRTRDPGRITLSLRSETEVVKIVISAYKPKLDESFVRTGSRTVNGLAVENFSVANQFREMPVVRLHDGKQQMLVYGKKGDLVGSLLQGCQEVKHGSLYQE